MTGLNIHSLTRRIDLFTLRLFLTVVEEQQIRRAALRENVTPSAATRRIQDLEDVTGIALFDNLPGGMVPSAAGEVLARHVRLLFANLDVMHRELSEFTEAELGVTVQSESMLSKQDFDKVATVPLDEPWAHRQICVGTKRGETLSAATKALVAQLTDR
jgi:DNA-binding transcriptional LysR family regulator